MSMLIAHFIFFSFGTYAFEAIPAACSGQGVDTELTSLLQDRVRVTKTDVDRLASTNGSIDFVYCWAGEPKRTLVNGEQNSDADHLEGNAFNEMQYSISSLQVFAPWFNKVYLLVDGQPKPPAWAAADSRIVMVDRCTLFPRKRDCPTKNIAACQTVMHRIPGLQERFVYMEDDWFLLRKMSPADFFFLRGRPLLAVPVKEDSITEMYGPREDLHGPQMPPEHVPDRIISFRFTHRAMPMTISFNTHLEKEFADWFAFVRSHKIRFYCCNEENTFTPGSLKGLDESFHRMYPAMLYKLGAGDQLPKFSQKSAALYGDACPCHNTDCITHNFAIMGAIAIQSCDSQGWSFARTLLDKRLETSKVTGIIAARAGISIAEGMPLLTRVGISAVDFALACCACWAIFLWWRSGTSMQTGFLGVTTVPQVVLLLGFISCSASYGFILERAGKTGYSIISATILVYIAKCVVSSFMCFCRTDQIVGFDTLFAPGCTRFGKLPACILPVIPGGLLAGGDCLTFLGLANIDPVTFLIFMNLRTVFVGILWEMLFRRKLSATQWLALLLFMVAGITKGFDRAYAMDTSGLQAGACITIVKALIGALACVFSEVLLKEMTMPTDLVNTCTYLWGLVWLVIMMLCGGGAGTLHSNLLSAAAWSKLQGDPWMIGSICHLSVWGIISAYLLKHLSNIVKESAQAFVIVISTALQCLLIDSSVINSVGMMGMSMAVLGVCVYSIDPLENRDKPVDSNPIDKLRTFK